MRSDYEYITVESKYFLVDESEDFEEPRTFEVDPETQEFTDGWQDVMGDLEDELALEKRYIWFDRTNALNGGSGALIKKIQTATKTCPECRARGIRVECYVDEVGDDLCGECGLICNGSRVEVSNDDFKFGTTRGEINAGPHSTPDMNHIPNKVYRPGDVSDGFREQMNGD